MLADLKRKHKEGAFGKVLDLLLREEYALCGPLLTIIPAFERPLAKKSFQVYS